MKMIRYLLLLLVLLPASRLSAQCSGDYTWMVNGNQVTFNGTVSPAGSGIAWDFGDSNYDYSNSSTVTHTYATAGPHTACVIVIDSVNFCSDSTCHTFTTGGCTADFTWVDSVGYVFFVSNSTLGNDGVYFWDFGDGNYSTQQYPSNNYAFNGLYQVCLTVYDSMQNICDSTCHFVMATTVAAAIEENTAGITGLSFYPNPADASATFSFQLLQAGNVNIAVLDIYGREISNQQTRYSSGKQQVTIATESFAAGAYIVQISMGGQSVQSRLIIAH
jgi:hypothetical protein